MAEMKKILSVILAAVMLLGMLPLTVFGAGIVAQGECGENGDNVKWVLTDDGTLTIFGEGEMKAILFDGTSFKQYSELVKKVIIKRGVTFISCSAFEGCTALSNVTIPDSVTSIGYKAFSDCSTLSEVTLPDSIEEIGWGAFRNCSSLASIRIPEKVISLNEYTFYHCTSLAMINIPKGVTGIGYGCFSGCKIQSVEIGDSCEVIGGGAFSNCTELKTATIGKAFKYYDYAFFSNCTSLETVFFKNDIEIHKGFFGGCLKLKDVYFTTPGEDESIGYLIIDATNPDFSATKTFTIHHNYKPVCEHDYKTVTTAATCKAEGKTVYTCSKCGDTYTETIAKKAHTPVSVPAVVATYEKTGLTEGTKCSVCGTVIKAQTVVPKLTAKFTDGENVKLDADKDVVAKSGITQAELKKAAVNGKILDLDGKELAANKAVGSGMTVVMPDGTKYTVIVPGDGDSDGKISASDARLALRQSVGLEKNKPQWFTKACNVDGEKEVKASDARLILRAAVGLEII